MKIENAVLIYPGGIEIPLFYVKLNWKPLTRKVWTLKEKYRGYGFGYLMVEPDEDTHNLNFMNEGVDLQITAEILLPLNSVTPSPGIFKCNINNYELTANVIITEYSDVNNPEIKMRNIDRLIEIKKGVGIADAIPE